jgi:hypothetical protein
MHPYHLLAHPLTRPVALIVGAVLLLAGRRLFWLFVGIVGFVAGYSLSFQVFHLREPGAQLLLAVVAGLVGVLLATFAQKLAIAIAGFLVGVYFAAALLGVSPSLAHASLTPVQDLVLLAGGVVAAVLAVTLFDVALIVLSSLAGAGLVCDALAAGGTLRWLLIVVLAAVGIAAQLGWSRRSRLRA